MKVFHFTSRDIRGMLPKAKIWGYFYAIKLNLCSTKGGERKADSWWLVHAVQTFNTYTSKLEWILPANDSQIWTWFLTIIYRTCVENIEFVTVSLDLGWTGWENDKVQSAFN